MRVALGMLGCKLNQAETERLSRELVAAGHAVVAPEAVADVYILNTCTVTRNADAKCRSWLRRAHRANPEARLVVTGCYAERVPEELARMEGVSVVAGNAVKPDLVSRLPEASVPPPVNAATPPPPVHRTRSFLKIQDGCNRECTYCIVPSVRGREKSRPRQEIVGEVKAMAAEGYHDVVLTGTEVGAYKTEVELPGLLEQVLGETAISRLRLSSLQPREITPELLEVWRDKRMCPHFHLCLQSGSDSVLRRMKRGYTTADFRRAVAIIRESVPDVSITSDVIVGFPGESEAEFAESLAFCHEIGFARIHVFPYSPRPGTAAAAMPGQIAAGVKKERSRNMLAVARQGADAFHRTFTGRTMPVLWESSKADGLWSGLTGNYITVFIKSGKDLANVLSPVTLTRLNRDGMWAEGET